MLVVQGAAAQNTGGQREKGGKGKGKQKGRQQQQRDQKPPRCFIYGEGHPMKDCAQWKQVVALTKKKPQGNA